MLSLIGQVLISPSIGLLREACGNRQTGSVGNLEVLAIYLGFTETRRVLKGDVGYMSSGSF